MIKTLRYLFVAALAMVMGNVMAEETIDFSAKGYANQEEMKTVQGTNVTITFEANGGTSPKYYTTGSAIRVYAKNNVIFTATKPIKVIKFGLDSSGLINDNNNGFDSGTYDAENTKWTGSASTLTLNNKAATGNQIRIQKLTIYYEGDEIPADVHIANTEETAYTVAQAFDLIDAGQALSETVYVKGIVSQVDKFNETYGSITYWISDDGTTTKQLECYGGLNIGGEKFTSKEDVAVGANVIVKGTLTKYNSTYEFSSNNQLVKYDAAGAAIVDGDYTVGIVRPLLDGQENTYADFSKITTANFNKSAAGLTVQFFENDAIKSTIVEDKTAENGYKKKDVCHQGVKGISCDYVWMLNCTAAGASNHNTDNPLGSEGWAFGFDLTVADGCTFAVNAIDFDLLVESNPAYCIRIMKGETELYNSTWVTVTGGYNNLEWGAGSYCRITKEGVSFLFEAKNTEGKAVNYQAIQYYPGFKEGVGVETPLPADFKLEAGTYRVIADVDFNKDSAKAMSFDNFTLEGTLTAGGADGIQSVAAGKAVKADNVMYNLAGQKVGADYKGLVIMNGKKVVIK